MGSLGMLGRVYFDVPSVLIDIPPNKLLDTVCPCVVTFISDIMSLRVINLMGRLLHSSHSATSFRTHKYRSGELGE